VGYQRGHVFRLAVIGEVHHDHQRLLCADAELGLELGVVAD
jgi:hypothetical protein